MKDLTLSQPQDSSPSQHSFSKFGGRDVEDFPNESMFGFIVKEYGRNETFQ
jgi:hypothetical protein